MKERGTVLSFFLLGLDMKNLLRLYKIASRYWGFFIGGVITMIFYGLFSGVSVTMAIPLFDYVFVIDKMNLEYTDVSSVMEALIEQVELFVSTHPGIGTWTNMEALKPLFENLQQIMAVTDSFVLLKIIAITTLVLYLLRSTFFFLDKVMFANLRGKTIRDLRNLMMKSYLKQSIAFYGKNRSGDSLVRMVNDGEIVSGQFLQQIFTIMRNVIAVLIFLRIALFLNAKLFLISIVILPIFSGSLNYLGNKIRKYARRVQQQFSNMFSAIEEIMRNMKIVKAYAREDYEYRRMKAINKRHFKYWRKSEIYNSMGTPFSEINSAITGMIVLLIGGRMVLSGSGDFSFGDFSAFLFAVFSMLHPVKEIAKAYIQIRRAAVSLERVSVVLDLEPEIVDDPDPVGKKSFDEGIRLEHVNFSYDGTKVILDDIDMTIRKGEKVALVGSSGSGKTTLVNLLCRMYDTTSGEILIDGIPIKKIRIRDLKRLFGYVTQDSILFSNSIENNIRYGTLDDVTREQVEKVCRIAHAEEFIMELDEGYETVLNASGSNLSGGQQQRLCIARSIVGDPPILIFDEATSALDTESERKVQQAIDDATRNRTVIMIAHRLSTILASDRIFVMDKGRVVGSGSHFELLETCPRYKTLYEMQFSDNVK